MCDTCKEWARKVDEALHQYDLQEYEWRLARQRDHRLHCPAYYAAQMLEQSVEIAVSGVYICPN
jgi:hypothetical protein